MPRRSSLIATGDYPELQSKMNRISEISLKIKELREELKYAKEEVGKFFEDTGERSIILDMGDHFVVLTPDVKATDKLDKGELAHRVGVEKKELSKPFDYSYWTSRGLLGPRMITECTHTEVMPVVKIRKKVKPSY